MFSFPRPSVVSDWLPIKSQGGNDSQVIFNHGLNELPYKVVVEVKVLSGRSDYIFHAIGSASADDDLPYDYGGIVYLYDENTVVAMAPNVFNGKPFGYAIYTGKYFIYSYTIYFIILLLLNTLKTQNLTVLYMQDYK